VSSLVVQLEMDNESLMGSVNDTVIVSISLEASLASQQLQMAQSAVLQCCDRGYALESAPDTLSCGDSAANAAVPSLDPLARR
jgi:hypothetical protein